ncbi:MAG: 1,4-alpha-glucan branching protein GlgB [Oscillospiraceae bacterium]|nr:1,4-alpha-glucan branching protein GlgB [Oscillospiraceae bacterium]
MNSETAKNDLPVYMFKQGSNFHAHEFFGCHFDKASESAVFRVWAPHASEISVVGDWNDWNETDLRMERIADDGAWEASATGVKTWNRYKYSVTGPDGIRRLKADPFAFHAETDGKTASIIFDITGYEWKDADYLARIQNLSPFSGPVNIYELHAGSWRRHPDGNPYTYIELADSVVPYLIEMGYTHLELMPIMEHANASSWGYRTCGYFAPTSRYGTPHDLMEFIDRCHKAGLGVILDWAPARFPQDDHGLSGFDGTPLFEAVDTGFPDRREWGTSRFDYGRAEVQSFLISNAVYWLEYYHADGLRACDVSSTLYLDCDKNRADRQSDTYGGNEDPDAITFWKNLSDALTLNRPGAMLIAEESTSWPMVTKSAREGGLGFTFKWNMGWINDMLDYVSVDPLYRKMVHGKITFSFFYAFSENFILPISHNEVVRGKCSLLDKMPGEYEWKFAGLRAFFGYMMMHPGKKLNFMGCEIGQFKEWDFESEVDWFLLDYPAHRQMHDYVKALNRFYLKTSALWEIDNSWDGFKWICADDDTQSIAVFMRIDKKNNALIVLQNFAPLTREEYCFGVPDKGEYREVFSSDRKEFGGFGLENGVLNTEDMPMHGFPYSLRITAPPLSTVCFRCVGDDGDIRTENS